MRRQAELLRFTLGERWVHWTTAALLGVCIATAAGLYVGGLAVLFGRRALLEQLHVWAGIGLPVPTLLGWASQSFRDDLRRLNRFSPADWEWLRSSDRRSGRIPVGKFNAGQKLNASLLTGSVLVLLGTGLLMRFANHWPVAWRTGATFVHDWLAFLVVLLVLGHLWFALRDPGALAGIVRGRVPASWARQEHASWAEEVSRPGEDAAEAPRRG